MSQVGYLYVKGNDGVLEVDAKYRPGKEQLQQTQGVDHGGQSVDKLPYVTSASWGAQKTVENKDPKPGGESYWQPLFVTVGPVGGVWTRCLELFDTQEELEVALYLQRNDAKAKSDSKKVNYLTVELKEARLVGFDSGADAYSGGAPTVRLTFSYSQLIVSTSKDGSGNGDPPYATINV